MSDVATTDARTSHAEAGVSLELVLLDQRGEPHIVLQAAPGPAAVERDGNPLPESHPG